MVSKPVRIVYCGYSFKKLAFLLIVFITSGICLYANNAGNPVTGSPYTEYKGKLRVFKAMPLRFNNIGKQLEYTRKQLMEGEDSARAYVKGYERMVVDDYTVTGNLYVSTANATGGGIVLADDGDIVDMNDGYAAMRFSQGVRIYSANRRGSPVINLQSDGYIWTSVYGYLQDGFLRATGSTSQNIDGIKYFYSHKGNGVYLQSTSSAGVQAFSSDGGAAFMSFHRANQYAINMGLDPDNVFRIGGWSDGNNVRMELDANGGARFKKINISSGGSSLNTNLQFNEGLIIEAKTGGRSTTNGAQLEFVIPANTDGSNMWGQARIITVAGNTGDGNATGKMILGTRRLNKAELPYNNWYYGDDLTIDGIGNVGIGTTDPKADAKLHVSGAEKSFAFFGPNQYGANLYVGAGDNKATANTGQVVSTNGNLHLDAGSSNNIYLGYYTKTNTFINPLGGKVGIGTTEPGDYMLAVKGDVKVKKLKVTQTDWADYVFAPTYKLLSLFELENYIHKYKHLPEVPSADEVAGDGLDVGANQAVLLKKIEELTLYVIEQAKRNDKLEEVNKHLLNRLDKLEKKN